MLIRERPAAQRMGTWNPKCAERKPEAPGPMRNPIPKAMPMSANARERSFGVVTSAMYAWAMERFPAVMPSMARARKTIHRFGAAARIRNPANVPNWLTSSTGLRPRRSESDPSGGPAMSWQPA